MKRLFAVLMAVVTMAVIAGSYAEDTEPEGIPCWVMCRPDSYVILRSKPKKHGDEFGGIAFGEELTTDGKIKNGFLHVFNLNSEESEGWIYAGYIVYDKPEIVEGTALVVSYGRLAARKTIGGKVIKWLKELSQVRMICRSEEWSLTTAGYVMTEFLQPEGDY